MDYNCALTHFASLGMEPDFRIFHNTALSKLSGFREDKVDRSQANLNYKVNRYTFFSLRVLDSVKYKDSAGITFNSSQNEGFKVGFRSAGTGDVFSNEFFQALLNSEFIEIEGDHREKDVSLRYFIIPVGRLDLFRSIIENNEFIRGQ